MGVWHSVMLYPHFFPNANILNMKHIISMALLAMSFNAAFADDISLGYCDGSVIDLSVSASSQTSVAVKFADSEFGMYHGSRITGVRIGAGSDIPKGVTVFLRDKLSGKNIYSMQTSALYQGWNDVDFGTSIDYPEGDLVVGYTISQGKIGLSGDAWTDGCWMLDGKTWTDRSSENGCSLCMQVVIDGDSYNKTDGALLRIDDTTVGKGNSFKLTGKLRNNTNSDLDNACISYTINGVTKEQTFDFDAILPGEIGSFSMDADAPSETGDYKLTASLKSVNGIADEYAGNNTTTADIDVIGELVKKNVLVENFTTQTCVNCPAAHTRLEEALKGRDDYVLVAHHYGNGTDNLTAFGSSDLQWFYNSNSMYAPGLMVDRVNMMDEPGPICVVPESSTITSMLNTETKNLAPVAVSVLRNYDSETRKLDIRVNAHVVEGESIGDTPVINVLLTEDDIIAKQSPNYENYQHNNVCRRFVTPVYGDPVVFVDNNELHKDYSETLPATWNVENMHVVAFVSNYNKNDCNDCHVYNAISVTLQGNDNINTGIAYTTQANATPMPIAIYDVEGRKILDIKKGLNIVRYTDGSVRKVMLK